MKWSPRKLTSNKRGIDKVLETNKHAGNEKEELEDGKIEDEIIALEEGEQQKEEGKEGGAVVQGLPITNEQHEGRDEGDCRTICRVESGTPTTDISQIQNN